MASTAPAQKTPTDTPKGKPAGATAPPNPGQPAASPAAAGPPTPPASPPPAKPVRTATSGADTLTVVITDPEDVRKVRLLAAAQGISRADVVRHAVRAHVTNQESVLAAALRSLSSSDAEKNGSS